MADQPTVEENKPVVAAKVSEGGNLPPPDTAGNASLPINVSTPTAPVSSPSVSAPVVAAPESPILVTESELTPSQASSPALAEEVENLSGEIQALEAKIDRLTGNIQPVVEAPKDLSPEKPPLKPETISLKTVASVETSAKPPAKEVEPESAPKPDSTVIPPNPPVQKSATKTAGINDIYSKIGEQAAKLPEAPSSDEAEDVSSGSSIGTIGEVLAVFGVIIFMAMTAFPFYKTMLSETVIDAIRSIGWPTAVICLALGFLLGLFSHGKMATKIFTVIILLFSVLLYMGVSGFQSYLGPLGPMLESVFTFYR